MITFVEQPKHEDLDGSLGPYVSFQISPVVGDGSGPHGDMTDVALPVSQLRTFYWAALNGPWAVGIGTLIGELRELGIDLQETVGAENQRHSLRVESRGGRTVLVAE